MHTSNHQWSVESEPVLTGVSMASTETLIASTTAVLILLVSQQCGFGGNYTGFMVWWWCLAVNCLKVEIIKNVNQSLWIELVATHTSFFWDALGCATIPTAIILADPCCFVSLHQNKPIITDIDGLRPFSGSIMADHTITDRWAINKFSVCTLCKICYSTWMSKVCFTAPCMPQITRCVYVD